MTDSDLEIERFIQASEEQWIDIDEGNSKSANMKVRTTDKLAARWDRDGVIESKLSPYLTHESAAIRFAAAAYLIRYGFKAHAVEVMRKLVGESSLISPSAAAVLRMNNIK